MNHSVVQPLRVLSVEDEPDFTELARRILEREGFAVIIERVAARPDLERALDQTTWDIVLSDQSMPGLTLLEALHAVQARGLDVPFILVSGHIGEDAAVEAMREGAHDYVPKTSLARLGVAVRRALNDAADRAALRQRERDLKSLLAEAQRAANFDAITGLPNRSSFLRKLGEQIHESAAEGSTFALLYADLDRFREINDAFGHEGGDAVLRELGVRIAAEGSVTLERVARLGVDDFAFLLPPGSGADDARRAAEDGIRFLREPFTLSEQPVHLSASIGIAAFPEHGLSAEELLRHAEAAMFAAKQSQTRYAVYGAALDAHSQQKIALLGDLRRALETDELTLHYQPQVDFRTNRLVGAEALLRWRHPERGMVPPLEFIPVAEETGLIQQLTRWVLKRALQQQCAWQRAGLELRLAVNVSMRNLRDPEFLMVVDALVGTSGVDSASITLEVTEAAMMLEAARTLDVLRRIRALGVNIAIDDFGTGYSSLAYLSRLPVNEVKIDRSFVMDLTTPGSRAIVRAVIDLGKAFGLRVVAEGVKDEATWKQVQELGCDIAQGYHLSEPLAAADFTTWATERTDRSTHARRAVWP